MINRWVELRSQKTRSVVCLPTPKERSWAMKATHYLLAVMGLVVLQVALSALLMAFPFLVVGLAVRMLQITSELLW